MKDVWASLARANDTVCLIPGLGELMRFVTCPGERYFNILSTELLSGPFPWAQNDADPLSGRSKHQVL